MLSHEYIDTLFNTKGIELGYGIFKVMDKEYKYNWLQSACGIIDEDNFYNHYRLEEIKFVGKERQKIVGDDVEIRQPIEIVIKEIVEDCCVCYICRS